MWFNLPINDTTMNNTQDNQFEMGLAHVACEEVFTEESSPYSPDDKHNDNMDQYLSLEAATEIMFPF